MNKKLCRACNTVKSIDKFNVSYGTTKDGYKGRCKKCEMFGRLIPKSAFKINQKNETENNWKLTGVSKDDFMFMYEIMTKLGYDVNGNVHEQFCDKYNLKYKYKKIRNENVYLPDGSKNPNHISR